MSATPPHSHRAFTLVEVITAAAILSFSVAAILQTITAAQTHTYEALHNLRGLSLAEAMLEEVLAHPYHDPDDALLVTPGPDAGESARASFDNLDDFHNLTETPANLTDAASSAYGSLFQVFTRSVSVAYTSVNIPNLGGTYQGLTITVTVTDDRGMTWTINRFVPEPLT